MPAGPRPPGRPGLYQSWFNSRSDTKRGKFAFGERFTSRTSISSKLEWRCGSSRCAPTPKALVLLGWVRRNVRLHPREGPARRTEHSAPETNAQQRAACAIPRRIRTPPPRSYLAASALPIMRANVTERPQQFTYRPSIASPASLTAWKLSLMVMPSSVHSM